MKIEQYDIIKLKNGIVGEVVAITEGNRTDETRYLIEYPTADNERPYDDVIVSMECIDRVIGHLGQYAR